MSEKQPIAQPDLQVGDDVEVRVWRRGYIARHTVVDDEWEIEIWFPDVEPSMIVRAHNARDIVIDRVTMGRKRAFTDPNE